MYNEENKSQVGITRGYMVCKNRVFTSVKEMCLKMKNGQKLSSYPFTFVVGAEEGS